MNNLIQHTTQLAMYLVQAYVRPGDTVIDATCGNGYDTLQLAEMLQLDRMPQPAHVPQPDDAKAGSSPVRPSRLFAFDIQPRAVEAARELLIREGFVPALENGSISLICSGHEHMRTVLSEGVAAVVFNLGYLPGGDKAVTTHAETTLAAVKESLALLRPGGLVCITMYSGHPEGAEEKRALLAFAEGLDGKLWHACFVSMPNQRHAPPEILLITRKG